MERINQFAFYDFGKTLQKLRGFEGDGDVSADAAFFPLVEARTAVEEICQGEPLDLVVSRACADTLHKRLNEAIDRHFRTRDEDGSPKWKFPTEQTPAIPSWQWSQIMTALNEFETIFREEMREAATYRVPNRGIFDTGKLVDAADQTFPPELIAFVPPKARDDWRAAGRCLAFNLLSASGFHVARAVEATLEVYYFAATGKTKALNGWHDYIKALTSKASNPTEALVPSDKVIAGLTQMKDDYRNPIVHPRVVLTEPDARMLFANGESLITAMVQEIKASKPATSALTSMIANVLSSGDAQA